MNENEEQKPWEKIPMKRVDSVMPPVRKDIIDVPSYMPEVEIEPEVLQIKKVPIKVIEDTAPKQEPIQNVSEINLGASSISKDQVNTSAVEKKKSMWPKFIVAGVLLVAVSFGAAYFIFSKSKKESGATIPSTEQMTFDDTAEQVAALLAKVESHMVLPEGNDFVVYTVTDLEPLKGQDFFRNATVGDKVIIWESVRKAILYSPTKDKIIEVSMVDLVDQNATSTPAQ
jgi:hypothetical protein